MRALASTIFTLALLAIPIQGHGRTWYIRADRNGDAPTIQAGIDSAQVGDDVLVAPGSYDELNQRRWLMGSLFRMKSGVWVHSEGGPAVTFLNGSGVDIVIACFDVDETATIEGFRISYASQYHPGWSHGGGGIYCSNSSPLITGNRIVDNSGGIVCLSHSSPTITGNEILSNDSPYVGGIYCHFDSSPSITYNVIAGNEAGIAGGGVYCQAGCYPVITNNTFYGNSAPEGSGVYVGSSEIISRNIFTGHTGGAVLECGVSSAPEISCNNFWDNGVLVFLCTLGENNVFADPLFCDPEAGDFSLCSFSPCVPGNPMGCGLIGSMGVGCDSCDPPDAVCTLEPPALDFGWVDVGFSKDLDFTISNDGYTSISGTVGESCEYYSILSGEGEYSLAPGESLTVAVRFEPRRPGTYGCAIETGNPACSILSCSGIGRVSGTPNSSGKWALHYAGPHDSKSNTCDFSIEDCDEVVVKGPPGTGRYDVYVVAVDVDRISATRYGLSCDGQFYFYGWTKCSALEIPTAGWPGCGEGNAQTWGQEQHGPHVTVGILDLYVYGVSTLMTSPDPRIGSAEWCDGTQPNPVCRQTSSPEAFGSVGFGRPGYNPSEKVNVTKTTWGRLKSMYR